MLLTKCYMYVTCIYMFGQHVTWLNPFVQGHLIHIMLYGYMFLRNT